MQECVLKDEEASSCHAVRLSRCLRSCSFQVHLGSGIWVDEEKWHQLQVTQGDSKYTKNLAVMIWGTDVLKNRSVTGVATKKKKDAVPKPPLSPHKLSIVRGRSLLRNAGGRAGGPLSCPLLRWTKLGSAQHTPGLPCQAQAGLRDPGADVHLVPEELPSPANEPVDTVQCMGRHGRGAGHVSGSSFLWGGDTAGSQGRISREGSLHWALKGPSDMEMQMCKERYFWKQKHLEQRQGDGKGSAAVCRAEVKAGAQYVQPWIVPRAVNDVQTHEGHWFQLPSGVWGGLGTSKETGCHWSP